MAALGQKQTSRRAVTEALRPAAAEPLEARAFVAELAVEALVGAVLPGFARIDVRGVNPGIDEPFENLRG